MSAKPKPNLEKIYLDRSSKQATAKTEYGTFNVLNSDYMGKIFLKGQHYEGPKIKKVLAHINEGDTVIDVGANFGIHTIPYARKVGETGRVISFEPQGVIFNLLRDNVKINVPNHDVMLYHEAVGHSQCTATMSGYCDQGKVIDYHRSQQTNYGGLNLGLHGERVQMKTLDSLADSIKGKLSVIKIDVEGAERLVIYGGRKLIEEHRPVVFYEDNWKSLTRDMINMFKLKSNIVKFNIRDFFLKQLKYSKIEKIGSNYLAIP